MPAVHTLLPYQSRWVGDASSLKICEKGRRIGLSWAEAYDSVLYAARAVGGGDVYYQSYAHETTRTFIDDCADWARRLKKPVEAVGETLLEPSGERAFRLPFASGRSIVALTNAPRAFRSHGKPGDRAVLDEAAFVDNLPEALKAALAFRVWGGGVRIISTHNGEGSAFNRLVCDVRDGARPGSLHTVRFRDAIAEGLHRRICAVAGDEWSAAAERDWEAEIRAEYGEAAEEELDCVPRSAGGAWLAWSLIRQAERPEDELAARAEGPAWIGVDVARRGDLWVLVVAQRVDGVLSVREIVAERGITFAEQRRRVEAALARWRPVRVAVDQTGMGEMFVEDLQRRFGRVIEGVLFSPARRLDIATALRQAFEDGLIRIPASEALRRDLHSVRQEAGATGAPRLVADRSGTDGHADRFWAMALAVAAAAEAPRRYAYHADIPLDIADDEALRRWGYGEEGDPLPPIDRGRYARLGPHMRALLRRGLP